MISHENHSLAFNFFNSSAALRPHSQSFKDGGMNKPYHCHNNLGNHKQDPEISFDYTMKSSLRASEERFRKLVCNMPVMITATNSAGEIIFWNKECEKITGYTENEIIKNPAAVKLLYPDKEIRKKFLRDWKNKKYSFKDWETTIATKYGTNKTICWSNISDEIEVPAWDIWAVGIDMTENRVAEHMLRSVNRATEKLVEMRTKELQATNERLKEEIRNRKGTENRLRKHQKQLAKLSSELLLTEERERRQIAKDLHDRIGHNLTISRLKLGELKIEAVKYKLLDKINEIETYIKQTIKDTRNLTFEISPPILYEIGLEAALEWLAEQISEQYHIHVEFFDDGNPKPLDQRSRVLAFRASRELLLNTAKHSGAKTAKISISCWNHNILVEVEDNGCGFEPSSTDSYMDRNGCFGLFSIQERLDYLNGQFELKSDIGNGTHAKIIVPMEITENTY